MKSSPDSSGILLFLETLFTTGYHTFLEIKDRANSGNNVDKCRKTFASKPIIWLV